VRRLFIAAGLTAMTAGMASCSYFQAQDHPYMPPAIVASDIRDGQTLFLKDCAWCHGVNGAGTERGPNIVAGTGGPALTRFVLSTGRMPIASPDEQVEHRPSIYTPAQMDAIAAYMEELGAEGPPVPSPRPERGDFALGAELYQENCAACHATTGIGGTLGSGLRPRGERQGIIIPGLDPSTPREIAEAMLTGPGNMPAFGAEVFSSHDVDSIIRYIESLQRSDNRGGLPMGRIGPWSEGAAGWLLGMGAMIAITLWIGTRNRA
jgi:ubiquinol-cytochrome c reductase cytochrome c subunit